MMLLKTFQRLRLQACAVAITWTRRDLQKIVSEIITCKYTCSRKKRQSKLVFHWHLSCCFRWGDTWWEFLLRRYTNHYPWDSWVVWILFKYPDVGSAFAITLVAISTAKGASNMTQSISMFNSPRERNLSTLVLLTFFVVWFKRSFRNGHSLFVHFCEAPKVSQLARSSFFFFRVFFGKPSVWWIEDWMVVSNIFNFHPYLGKWSNLTSIFFRWVGSTPQLEDEFESSPQNVEIFKPNVSQTKKYPLGN